MNNLLEQRQLGTIGKNNLGEAFAVEVPERTQPGNSSPIRAMSAPPGP